MFGGFRAVLLLVAGATLFGCGGGGGGSVPTGDVRVSLSYSPPSATVGTDYRYAPNYSSNQSIDEHFEISGGSLPPGLGISAGDGVISGKPGTAGNYCFTVTLTAKNVSGSVSANGCITIYGGTSSGGGSSTSSPGSLSITLDYQPPAGIVGQAYNYAPTLLASQLISPSFSATGLPPGISIGSGSGILSGTPTQSGVYVPNITMGFLNMTGAQYRYPIITILAAASSSSAASSTSSTASSSGSAASSASSVAPVLSASPASLQFGGTTGRSFGNASLTLSLNQAGSNAWSIISRPAWLVVSKAAGSVGASSDSLSLSADVSQLTAGSQSGVLRLQTVVGSQTITRDVPVSASLDQRRLMASETGIAFTKTPAWSRLSRIITVRDNFGSGSWTASADQTWLSVTHSGNSGDGLTLTADPTGLSADSLAMATVTVSSANGARGETIRVGLWVGSSTPSAASVVPGASYVQLIADPVRPYVYAHNGDSTIDRYNVYTGLRDASISVPGAVLGGMAVSQDGSSLYALNIGQRVVAIDLTSRTVSNGSGWSFDATVQPATSIGFIRPNGEGVLLLGKYPTGGSASAPIRVSDGAVLPTVSLGIYPAFAVTSDQTHLATFGGAYDMDYSASAGLSFMLKAYSGLPCDGATHDIAIRSTDNLVVAGCVASGTSYGFPRATLNGVAQGSFIGAAYPNNAEATADGRLLLGSTTYGGNTVWLYRSDNTLVKSYAVPYLLDGQLRASGDGFMAAALAGAGSLNLLAFGPDGGSVSGARFVQLR